MRLVNTYIGAPLERAEDFRFLTGRGTYVADLDRPRQVHMVVLRSGVAHGLIQYIDTAAAKAMPGVVAVMTARDLPSPVPMIPFRRPIPSIVPYGQPVMATDKVRYVGEPIAVVLAESAEIAEDALGLIEVDIEPLPALIDARAAKAGAIRLFDAAPDGNVTATFTGDAGDVDAALTSAALVLKRAFRTQRQTALPMETRGLLAEWDDDGQKLTVSGAAKLPFFNRRAMAKVLGIAETQVDYIEYDVGGGFGARGEFYPEDALVAICARTLKRPVKWIEDRREHLTAIGHSRENDGDIEMGFAADGRILALRGELFCNIGAYMRPNGTTAVRNAAQFIAGPYKVGNFEIRSHAIVTNKTPAGTYRGPGRYESCFFFERMLDLAAGKLGIDRVEIRRRNLIPHAEIPYRMVDIGPADGWDATYYDSGNYAEGLDACLKAAQWADKAHLQGKLVDGRYHGLGLACFVEGGASGPREHVKMRLVAGPGSGPGSDPAGLTPYASGVRPAGADPAGGMNWYIALDVGSSSIGQGIETIFAQIAADALEITPDRITVRHGSTTLLKEGFGSYGSRATVMGGCAVIDAAEKLLAELRAAAARRLGVDAGNLRLANGTAEAPDGRKVGLADVAGDGLVVDGVFHNSKPTFTYGTGVAHVAVDAGTGHVEVIDYTVVDDVGRIINPETLHGQVMGAAVQGMGSVFSEHLVYDDEGQLLVGSLADYQIPLATDYPNIHCVSTERYPSPNNPLGAKGAGEGGLIPVGAAVANAVANALGSFDVEPNLLPLSAPRLWEMIEEARGRRV